MLLQGYASIAVCGPVKRKHYSVSKFIYFPRQLINVIGEGGGRVALWLFGGQQFPIDLLA